MTCPRCHAATRVIDSRASDRDATRRRRECLICDHRFSTREVLTEARTSRMERLRAVAALRQAAEVLTATVALVTETAAALEGPRASKEDAGNPGRPREDGADDFERCTDCGALVWREQMAEHRCAGYEAPGQDVTIQPAPLQTRTAHANLSLPGIEPPPKTRGKGKGKR